MRPSKEVSLVVIELSSKPVNGFVDQLSKFKFNPLFTVRSIEEFSEILQFEPVDFVAIVAPLAQLTLLKKAKALCEEYQHPLVVISDDEFDLEEITILSTDSFVDGLRDLMEERGFQVGSSDHQSKSSVVSDNKSTLIQDSIFVKTNQQYKRVPFKDILFIKSDHVYLEIHTLKKTYLVRSSFKEYADKLPANVFYRAHKSYMVNVNHIDVINQVDVVINQVHIPISREFKAFITKSIKT